MFVADNIVIIVRLFGLAWFALFLVIKGKINYDYNQAREACAHAQLVPQRAA